jgi:PEP-CTERM motif
MTRWVVAALGAAVIAMLGASSAAHASIVSFDFSALGGSITHNGTSLSDSTFLDFDDATMLVTSVGTGDASGLRELVDTIKLTAETSPASSEIIYGSTPGPLKANVILSWPTAPAPGADTFIETLTTVTSIVTDPKIDPDFIAVTLTGTLSDTSGAFKDARVELMFSATQAGGNRPSVSFSNASIVSTIPEPSTWVMMTLGFAALGYVASRRREANVAALPA